MSGYHTYLLAASQDMVLLLTPETFRIVAVSPAITHRLGWTEPQLLGHAIGEFECALADLFFWDEIAKQGEAGQGAPATIAEGEYRLANGETLPVLKRVSWVHGSEGWRIAVQIQDQRLANAAESALADTMSLLRATLEATADGILVLDSGGHILNLNHRFVELWQIDNDILLSGNDGAVLDHIINRTQDADAFALQLAALEQGQQSDAFTELVLTDGSVFEWLSRPQVSNDRVLGQVLSFRDITDKKQAELALINARDAAESANRAKSDFLSQMSHELRTPLNAILGFAQLLEDEVTPTQKESIEHITKAGWHLLGLINEVLDLAKIEAGKLRLVLEDVPLNALLKDCLEFSRPLTAKLNVTLHSAVPDHAVWCVRADPGRLRQMMLNLLSNAIKYNRPNGKVTVSVSALGVDRLRISVTDTGMGISLEDQLELFEPFNRVGSQQQSVEGTGIGLSFTRKLAQLMNGEIGLRSVEGEGSTFWIDLGAVGGAERTQAQPLGTQARRVLYLEDDPVSTLLMQNVFKQYPHWALVCVADPNAAIAAAMAAPPDLILLDYHLPGTNGEIVLSQLRAHPALLETPIFALSANGMPDDIARGLAAGFSRYLTKPIRIPEFQAALNALFG